MPNSYLDPDITGKSPDCINNRILSIFQSNQIIEFDVPVYYNSLVIKKHGTDIVLQQGVDYSSSKIDYTSMGEIKYAHEDWDNILVKSIVIKNNNNDKFNIELEYQQLYPSMMNYIYYRGYSQLEFTPELVIEMLDRIQQIESILRSTFYPNEFSQQSISAIKIAELDINGTDPNNNIKDEIHTVNTLQDVVYVSPIYGSFFKDSVSIKIADTNTELVENTDYEILGLNPGKTKVTSNHSGVYDFIKITKQLIGNINISYHAFGGLPTLKNFKVAYNHLYTVLNYLNKNQIVTSDSLATNQVIISLGNKIYALEEQMRNLLNGSPTYGDVTYGTSSRKRIVSTNNNLNWWNIASLFKVEGSNSLIMKDLFRFRIELMNSGINLEGSIIVDLTKDNDIDRFKVVINNNNERSNLKNYKLSLRAIWNQNVGYYSGLWLQLGIALQDYLQETIGIEDLSGKESGWLLISPPSSVIGPENDNIKLPDESIWISNQNTSHVIETPIPLRTGIDILGNDINVPLNSDAIDISNLLLSIDDFIIESVKEVEYKLQLHEDSKARYFIKKVPTETLILSDGTQKILSEELLILEDGRKYRIRFDCSINSKTVYITSEEAYSKNPSFTLQQLKLFY